jgi:hypothetical protein
VAYRNNIVFPELRRHERRLVIFKKDGSWKYPPGLLPGEKPLAC